MEYKPNVDLSNVLDKTVQKGAPGAHTGSRVLPVGYGSSTP
mgnify:CR=1 FL=1